jgi:glycosyltransferase involved in cell wall biosynthesis
MTPVRRPRLCYVAASEGTVAAFLKQHIAAAGRDYEVSVAVNTEDPECLDRLGIEAALRPMPIERKVSLLQDLRALWRLYRLFRRECFDLVHSISPKAGLLAMLAAWLARVPRRVHSFTGQVWVTRQGWRRYLLKQADRLIAALATQALVDSPSQRDFLVAEGVMSRNKAEVIGKGSICGVDGVRFHPDSQARREVRDSLGIPANAPLLLFLGRLNRDKGVLDLAAAFMGLVGRVPDAWLVLVGPDEEGLVPEVVAICGGMADRVRHLDFTREPERYMAAADIFCLPSYREGFGTVVIEAAATGLPAVASRIYGITDAVVEGVTGLLHPPGDVGAIEAVLARLLAEPAKRLAMGDAARERALAEFSQAESSRELMAFYGKMFD